jgi:predicted signal transduction protein with EAL and GGDEF domain
MTEGSQDPADDLLRQADIALYAAKEQGKDRFEVFVPSMRDEVFDRLELKADLLRALEHEQFTPNSAT